MKIVVFGAAGRTGRHVVERALGHGHEVTAFVHRHAAWPSSIRRSPWSRATCATSTRSRRRSSGTGRWRSRCRGLRCRADIHEAGIANVIHAMAEHDGLAPGGGERRGHVRAQRQASSRSAYRALIATTLRSVYDDLEAMEMRIMASDLDWTIVRPVGLTDDPRYGRVPHLARRLAAAQGDAHLARRTWRRSCVKALETDTYHRRAVVIAQ